MIDLATHRPLSPWRRLFYTGPSTDVLYEDYARRGRIDDLAPISARCETIIDAPTERVWELLSQPQRWEQFASEVRDVRLDDGVVEGGRFTWRNGKTKLSSRFALVNPGRELTWTGTALGSQGRTPPPPHPDEQQPDTPRQRGVDGRPPPRPVLQQRQAPRLTQHLARRHHRRRATLDGLPTRAHPSPRPPRPAMRTPGSRIADAYAEL